jgi:hypothetical protein
VLYCIVLYCSTADMTVVVMAMAMAIASVLLGVMTWPPQKPVALEPMRKLAPTVTEADANTLNACFLLLAPHTFSLPPPRPRPHTLHTATASPTVIMPKNKGKVRPSAAPAGLPRPR